MNINNARVKKINRIARPIIALIIPLVLLLMIPILQGVAAIPFLVFGQQVAAYIVSRLIQNLYGPLLMVIFIVILPVIYRIISALRNRGVKANQTNLKSIAMVVFMLVLGVSVTFNAFKNITNLILDVGIIATSDYAKAEGILELYEVSYGDGDYTYMKINTIEFDGGNVQAGALIEGEYYQVEYLPHTKYVVKYKHTQ